MRQTSSIALGRPRLAQEWPPGPSHGDARAQAADRVHGDVHESVALQRQRQLRLQLRAGGARTREVAEPLLADREGDRESLQAALARHLLDNLDGAHDGGGVVADARAAQPLALEHAARAGPRARTPCRRARAAARAGGRRRSARSGCRRRRRPPARRAAEAPLQPRDALALVERRRRHARQREQVVEGIVHGAHAARTLSARRCQAAIAPGWPPAVRARNAAAASIAASTLKPRSRAWAISITCSTASAL